jgi:DNA-binding MarR family transcriptional regulator
MDELSTKLNNMIVNTFNSILKVEQEIIQSFSNYNLTIAEIHLLEQVGYYPEKCTISELASSLKVKLPTVTVAVNKLVTKNCLLKEKNPIDTRSINISLTETGKKINRVHIGFHKKMISDLSEGMSDKEIELLIHAIGKLQAYFDNIVKR